ncbi:hypothetical protein HJC10_15230 [Corallococcus exiguus]|uniref:hypothetical protein n=1 Tax=Corallococcus TaxID=83461 RepID=UPI000ED1E8B2|nr:MULTISPECIES: hypothetical protein [Corallococcus]NNB85708.1 hypothetical protein [Corallococcus exiguus]NNB96922.1 hypothetical protein [Corallococcus exiguus]NNC04190.1 hypothetical protein [Corallococcus exiguus]NPC46437.1 hypothetical protein [Corallococcus exiguus]RKH79396.1 hypothetical protein D7X99_24985 [Corallococcus sp. AB032C]
MPSLSRAGRALWRVLKAGLRRCIRACRLVLILILVVLPNPLVMVLSVFLGPDRRNHPAEVLRKKKE